MAVVDTAALSPVVKSFLAGSISGTCSTILFQPFDLVKTRLQTPKQNISIGSNVSMMGVFEHVVRTEKIIGLWRGMIPSMLRCVPGVGLYFSSMHGLKNLAMMHEEDEEIGMMTSMAVGAGARTISSVMMIPMTVVKTRYESGVYGYSGVVNAVRTIYTKEGLKGLTCGLVPTVLRDAPFSGLYLMFYLKMKSNIPKEWEKGFVVSLCHFGCGVTSGLLSSVLTQPFDVLKTKMQLYPNKFNNLLDVVVYVHRKYGYKGYFKGLVPRMVRRTLVAAMAWTVYERMMVALQLK